MRKNLIKNGLLPIAIGSIAVSGAQAQDVTKPNILHIVMDDVGWDDLSCFGATDINTPEIDALAADGMMLMDFYAPHGTSTPSRASMLTGRYAPRMNGGEGLFVLFPHSKTGLEDEMEVCITELLKEEGYNTGLFGKWHLGHLPQYLPINHGFDQYVGIPYPNDHGPERLGGTGVRPNGISDPPIPLIYQTEIVKRCDNNDLAELPGLFRQEACKFMYKSVQEKKPFYVQYANIETHTPYFIPRGFEGMSDAKAFGDAVQYLDNTVGVLMDMLRRLKIEDNTLVIITSDNGPLIHKDEELENCYGKFGETDPTRKHVLRGGKYQEKYDGGIRVSCIMKWPGIIPAGTKSEEIVTSMDLFTLMADISGAEVPTDRPIDGKDIMPIIKGEEGAKSPHEAIFGFRPRGGLSSVRSGDWKLVIHKDTEEELSVELYNLKNDEGEMNDLSKKEPKMVKKLLEIGRDANESLNNNKNI